MGTENVLDFQMTERYLNSAMADNPQLRCVDAKLATFIGLKEALVLDQIHRWFIALKFEDPNNGSDEVIWRNIKGEAWLRITYVRWHQQFPVWSISTIRRIILNLRKIGLIKAVTEDKLIKGSRNSHLHYQIDRNHRLLKTLNLYTED